MKRLFFIVGLWLGLSTACWAVDEPPLTEITPADAAAIHETVQAQLDALAEDDAVAAFALTTLEKRELIGSPANFLRLVREMYEPIYRNKSQIFSPPEIVQGTAVQIVRIADSHSKVWVVVFWMLQEEDAHWRIDDYHLLETSSVSI